jgi:hypothetical protein
MLNIISFWGPQYVISIFGLCLLIYLGMPWWVGPNDVAKTDSVCTVVNCVSHFDLQLGINKLYEVKQKSIPHAYRTDMYNHFKLCLNL